MVGRKTYFLIGPFAHNQSYEHVHYNMITKLRQPKVEAGKNEDKKGFGEDRFIIDFI